MSDRETIVSLEEVDRDGAISETAEEAFGTTRSDFFRKAAAGGTAD
jgi:hypothetical protein